MIQGIHPVIKLSNDLEIKIVEKPADDMIGQKEYEMARESNAVNGEVLLDTIYEDGMLYRKDKIWFLRDKTLKKIVFENEHDTMVTSHMDMDKILVMINGVFYWPRIVEDIGYYVGSSDNCQRNKASHHKRHGTLHPLEMSYSPYNSISIDFKTHLLVLEDCSNAWEIVDHYTKMAHFVPVKNTQKTEVVCTKRFLVNVRKLHNLPSDIVSDRDPVFTSTFWSELIKKLDVRMR